jgi:adenylate cyclase
MPVTVRAAELIAKAVASYNVVIQYAGNMGAEFEVEKRELCVEARKLFEAIRAASGVEDNLAFKLS